MSEMSPLKNGKSNSRNARKKKVRYYIGKKQYVPGESDLLCATEHTACIDTDTYDRIFGIPEKG